MKGNTTSIKSQHVSIFVCAQLIPWVNFSRTKLKANDNSNDTTKVFAAVVVSVNIIKMVYYGKLKPVNYGLP